MNLTAIEASRGSDGKGPSHSPGEPSSESLARIQALYDSGLCRQAYDLACSSGPIERWRGMDALILAGRISMNLGATRLALRQHVRAYHAAPKQIRAQAFYLEAFLSMRGPVFAWQTFNRFEQNLHDSTEEGKADEGRSYLFSLGARICGHLRDFERAETLLKRAEENRMDSPWLCVERSTLLTMQEQWEESLKGFRRALEIRPWYRPAVQHLALCLHTLGQDQEALQLLEEALQRIESLALTNQLASLQMDLEKYAEALATLDRAAKFSPIADKANQNWIAALKCRAACAVGDYAQAEAAASQLQDEYHGGLLERLRNESKNSRRVQLSVPFIQQYRLTCVPATLTMLFRFWKLPASQVEVADAICYDGTPSHRARHWGETHGMAAREFTLNWPLAVALLDRQIPFAVYTTEAASAHVQIVAGYDELRRTFILRNPSFPQIQEASAEQFLKHYAACGPACMVLVPAGMKDKLEGLNFPDAPLYDQLRTIQQALEEHRRDDAGARFLEMQAKAPDQALTLTAGRALYSYDTNLPALLECLDKLLVLFPQDGNLLLAKLGILREIGRREERLEFLRNICASKKADAVFHKELAHEMMADARQNPEAQVALKKSLRFQPLNAYTITTLAHLYWNQRSFDKALDLYRQAACIEDKKEPPSGTYFAAANARRQTEPALAFLRRRWERDGTKSPNPFITWFNALRQISRAQEALDQLAEVLRSQPKQGELWLTAADGFARHGKFEKADQCLATAEGNVPRARFLFVKADLARYRAEPKAALSLWREALQIEPLSMHAHRCLVWITAESEGRDEALRHLQEVCERFPHHYQLHHLWCEWARGAGPEVAETVVRKLLQSHPADAWARRELALVLCEAARFEEALAEAEEGLRLAPQQSVSHATRAHVHAASGRAAEAQADYREAIRLAVDYAPAIHGLVNSFSTVNERREALAFIEQELVRQVVYGDGLRAYRDAARLNLEPAALLTSLRQALRERPDLPAAWCAVTQQLAEMLELDEALKLAQDASERFPLQEQVWLDLALVHRLRLEASGERSALEQAMRVSPVSSIPARMLAQFYERSGEMARARELLEEACVRAPLDVHSHGALANVLWHQGQQAAAMEKMRHALKVQPGYTWGWQTLASWSAANGQPKLAEELAKIMVLQRPGDIHAMLVLARLLATTKRLAESLPVVDQALKQFQRSAEAHELRAQILEAMGKRAEADAACDPEIFNHRPPAALRACRARMEAQRGNLVSAIERMQAVLQENTGFAAGWQDMADWLWQRKQPEEALAAITNVRRLDPLNPVPLGYRANMKMQKKDRAGAKVDLEFALKLSPGYSFAALNLFELQLADAEMREAGHTLELIKRHLGGEKAKACEVKFRTKFLQVSMQQPSSNAAEVQQQRTHELEQAFARFQDLCSTEGSDPENFEAAIKALMEAGQTEKVEQMLAEAIKTPTSNPAVGAWWMRRRLARRKWFCTGEVNRQCPQSEPARQAVITLIESLGRQKRYSGKTIVAALLIIKLTKWLERQGRSCALLWLAFRHRAWLRKDNHGWASMGFALVKLTNFRAASWWMRDWRDRSELQMWMLLNLALALRSCRCWQEAREVVDRAVKLPVRDHTYPKLRLLLAMDLALNGITQEASQHFRELNASGWDGYMDLQYHYTKGLLAVQQAAPAEKRGVFRAERAAIRKTLARHRTSTFRSSYRRCLSKMARDAGHAWMVVPIWMGL
jgi:cellulose synthase operon protein C